ncbi:hypothetical protein TAC_0106 [Acinetobacter phage TAC1]|nr:hypothetical protein TAC_0106 [Acinetobacter phage TAC1]UYL86254.1 hypothetical protein [Acinetobacter phage vB_AbaM_CP14]
MVKRKTEVRASVSIYKDYGDRISCEFIVSVVEDGKNVPDRGGAMEMLYFKDTKAMDFINNDAMYGVTLIPFSKVEEFRNWLIANNFEG